MGYLDLTKILKNTPKGTKLYSSVLGYVTFDGVVNYRNTPIKCIGTNNEGKECIIFYAVDGSCSPEFKGECVLFPTKSQRDWTKFKVPIPDKSLVWCWDINHQTCRTLGFYDGKNECKFNSDSCREGIAYDYYELYESEWPEWTKEAIKLLKD